MLQVKTLLAPLSTAPAAMLHVEPLADEVIWVTVAPVSPAGKVMVSVTTTPSAADGPLFRNDSTYVAISPALTGFGVTDLPVISTSAIGRMVTVSEALLLPGFGSPSAVLNTVAVLVKVPSCSGRFTGMLMTTCCP